MSTKNSRAKAAKTAEATPAEAVEETPAAGTPADLAPLEPPTGDDTPAAEPEGPHDPPAEPTGDPDVPAPAPSEDPAEEPASEPEEEKPAAPPLAAPASVLLDAPPAAAADDEDAEEEPAAISIAEHATKKLELDVYAEVTDTRGNLVDPDEAFSDLHPSGNVQCYVRLIEHSRVTEHKRQVQRLLLAQGSWISLQAAERVKTRLRQVAESVAAQRAAHDAEQTAEQD